MAEDRLIFTGAAGLVLLGGAAAELIAAPSIPAGVLDWTTGAIWVVAAVRAREPGDRRAVLGLVTATLWFLSSALEPLGWGLLLTIAYRGPLLHWVAARGDLIGRRRTSTVLLLLGYVAALVATDSAAVATGVLAVALALLLLRASQGSVAANIRRAELEAAALSAALGVLWLVAAAGVVRTAALQAATVVVLAVIAWRLSEPAVGLTSAMNELVIDLGTTRGQQSPVSASLANALADPGLRIRVHHADLGWRDELGRPAPDPMDDGPVTSTTSIGTPSGGRVVLVHGPAAQPDSRLAGAAAAAAALVFERVSAEAELRREADDVRRSAARLLSVDEAEQAALGARLESGPIAVLNRVGTALRARDRDAVGTLLDELEEVIVELQRLSAGLSPGRIGQVGIEQSLLDLARGSPIPVIVTAHGLADLSEEHALLVFFVSAEGVTNVMKHAEATSAAIEVRVDERDITVEVRDDGHGGASLGSSRGLQGLADRVALAGGSFSVRSPPGGPTVVRAVIPRSVA